MNTTSTEPIDLDAAKAAHIAAIIEGPGHDSSRHAQVEAEQKIAHAQWVADGGEAGEKRRAKEAAQAEKEIVDEAKRLTAYADSWKSAIASVRSYGDEYAALEAAIPNPKVGHDALFRLWVDLCTAVDIERRVHRAGAEAIAQANGNPIPYRAEFPETSPFATVVERARVSRSAIRVEAAVTAAVTRASTAYTSAVK